MLGQLYKLARCSPRKWSVHEIVRAHGINANSVTIRDRLNLGTSYVRRYRVNVGTPEIVNPLDRMKISRGCKGKLITPSIARKTLKPSVLRGQQPALHYRNPHSSTTPGRIE